MSPEERAAFAAELEQITQRHIQISKLKHKTEQAVKEAQEQAVQPVQPPASPSLFSSTLYYLSFGYISPWIYMTTLKKLNQFAYSRAQISVAVAAKQRSQAARGNLNHFNEQNGNSSGMAAHS